MGFYLPHFRDYIIKPVLKRISPVIPYSLSAENLLLGTCAKESDFGKYLVQLEKGPAVSVYQIEPETYLDLFINTLSFNKEQMNLVKDFVGNKLPSNGIPPTDTMVYNLHYATLIARLIYYRAPKALPAEDDIEGLAKYYKIYFNSIAGKATEEEFVTNYHRYITNGQKG